MFGVPNLLKKAAKALPYTLLGNAVSALYDYFVPAPMWGIYFPGTTNIAMHVSSIVELDVSADAVVSDYPIETGSFNTYNKVIRSQFFGVRVTRDGMEYLRSDFLNWLEVERVALSKFDVVCPEYTWANATLVSYRITRNAGAGASMVSADLIFQQIRETSAEYENSKIEEPENQETTPTVRVSAVPNPTNVQATDLPPLQ